MKVLWLCNTEFTKTKIKGNGSWLQPLAEQLQSNDDVQLYNITTGIVANEERKDYGPIPQWIIPKGKVTKHGQEPSLATCKMISSIINKVQPDLVHIWGTESIWASVVRNGFIRVHTLIDIQGLLSACAHHYYGGLTFAEIFRTISLKELLMPWRFLPLKKRAFKIRGNIEVLNIRQFNNIAFQSQWVKSHIDILNKTAQTHSTRIMLREQFYSAYSWQYSEKKDHPTIFSSTSAAVSYKGLHVLIKAIALLKQKHPNIRLHLAGNINVGNRLIDGYSIFLKKLISRLDLSQNVIYMGSLDEDQIIHQLQQCQVSVVPSFVESYCLAFAESMIIGAPTVAAFSGAMPELAENRKEALFYNPTDYISCAAHIDELLSNRALAEKLSINGRHKRLEENNREKVVSNQLAIYKKIVHDNQSHS